MLWKFDAAIVQPAGGPAAEMLDLFAENPDSSAECVGAAAVIPCLQGVTDTDVSRCCLFEPIISGTENGTDTGSQEAWLHAD